MVSYSTQALDDFDDILQGLLRWDRIILTEQFTIDYIDNLKSECEHIPYISHHFPTTYLNHKRFGNFVHRHRHNKRTMWHIIYNKIISNHITP